MMNQIIRAENYRIRKNKTFRIACIVIIHGLDFAEFEFRILAHLGQHVDRKTQLLRGDQDHLDPRIARQRLDERMDRTAEFQVAAEADRHVVETPLLALDRQKVRKGLRRVAVAAVARIDDRNSGVLRSYERRALLEVAHGDNVRETADHTYGVRHGFAFRHGRRIGVRKADDAAPQLHHGGGETQAGAGRRLVKERRQLAPLARFAVFGAVGDDIFGQRHDLFGFGHRQVGRVNQVSHRLFHLSKSGFAAGRRHAADCTRRRPECGGSASRISMPPSEVRKSVVRSRQTIFPSSFRPTDCRGISADGPCLRA